MGRRNSSSQLAFYVDVCGNEAYPQGEGILRSGIEWLATIQSLQRKMTNLSYVLRNQKTETTRDFCRT